jgi:hypothetical protein
MTPIDLDEEQQIRKRLAEIEATRQQQEQASHDTRRQFSRYTADAARLLCLCLALFTAADYASGQIENGGFVSYALHYVGQYSYFVGITLAAVLIAGRLVWPIVAPNLPGLVADWQTAPPTVRLAVLAALVIGILHFLTSVVPHAS